MILKMNPHIVMHLNKHNTMKNDFKMKLGWLRLHMRAALNM